MGQIDYYPGGTKIANLWDDPSQTFTSYDIQGNVTLTRPYTAAEQARAAALATSVAQGTNQATLQQQGINALTANQTYLGIASPTNAQVVAQVQALTKQMDGVIRLLLNQLNATT